MQNRAEKIFTQQLFLINYLVGGPGLPQLLVGSSFSISELIVLNSGHLR